MNDHPVFPWLTAPRRAWLYRVAAAVLAVGLVFQVLTDVEVARIAEAIAAVLGVGTAVLHTPRSPGET